MITRYGKPAAVLIAPDELDALEEASDLLSDPEAKASLRRAEGDAEYLSPDEARARWSGG